jgi:hypothetical protein
VYTLKNKEQVKPNDVAVSTTEAKNIYLAGPI